MKLNRSKLRIEELERRDNPSSVNVGFTVAPLSGTGVVQFDVAGYTLFQVNAQFATSSSAFGFSEANMTAAQAVTTALGGTVNAALGDAYDGALSWGLAQANGTVAVGPSTTPLTYTDLDGIVDITGTPTSPLHYGAGAILTGSAETQNLTGDSFNGLSLQQQNTVFDLNGAPVVRTILFVTNTTGATITQNIGVFNNLGSDSPDTKIFATSSGDTTFTPGTDTWVGSFENYIGTTSTDPRQVFQLQGGFGHISAGLNASSVFVDTDDNPHFNFTATLAAGETKAFMVFNGLYASKAAGLATNSAFTSFGALQSHGLLAGLTPSQLKQIQNWDLTPQDQGVAVAAEDGPTNIELYDTAGNLTSSFIAFDGFVGGVELARGDVSGDGVNDVIAGVGPGAGPHVKVFDGTTGAEIRSFFAYDGGFDGGVTVASADVNGDGHDDVVVGTMTASSHVKVFDGATGAEIMSFFAFEGFSGGISVAAGDVDGDGYADIIVGTRTGSSHVKVFSGATGAEIRSFFAFDVGFTGGVSVAAGDLSGDGHADIIVGARTVVSHVKAFSGNDLSLLQSFIAFDGYAGGISVSITDTDGDGDLDIGVGTLEGGSHFTAFHYPGQDPFEPFDAFDSGYKGGINVA